MHRISPSCIFRFDHSICSGSRYSMGNGSPSRTEGASLIDYDGGATISALKGLSAVRLRAWKAAHPRSSFCRSSARFSARFSISRDIPCVRLPKTNCRYDSISLLLQRVFVMSRICLMIVDFPLSPPPRSSIYAHASHSVQALA